MTITDIITEYGAYYEQAGQNKNRILGMLSQGIETPKHATPIKTDDTIFRLSQLAIGEIIQGFQKAWTPKAPIAITPNELRLEHFKVDLELTPDDIEATWLGFLASEAVDRKDWPLVKFLIEHPDQGIIASINRDMELKEYGFGEKTAITPNTASAAGKTMDGLITLIKKGVAAETMNSIDIGELSKATIVAQLEEFIDQINQEYQHTKMNMYISPQWFRHYLRDKRAEGYYMITSPNQVSEAVDFSNITLLPLPSIGGSDIFFVTPKTNLLHLTKKGNNKTKFQLQERHRVVSVLADWWEGLGFGIDAAVWTNYTGEDAGSSGDSGGSAQGS